MVRYIKDGAYTIVVDDVPSPSKDKKDKGQKGEGTSPSNNGSRPTSPGSIPEEESIDEMGDRIDYASASFILQNLSIATPTFEQDRSNTMRGRSDITVVIAEQIAFYTYCALQPYTHKPEITPQILVFGDGFVGAKVISTLATNGCTPLLRVFTRGDISAKEWRAKGFQAGCNLPTLVNNQKPAIIIICSEYSSFHMIYHQMSELELLQPNACIITSTLGFQRKKLAYNFRMPTVFRTYVEPTQILKSYRSELDLKMMELLKFDFSSAKPDGTDEDVEEKKELTKADKDRADDESELTSLATSTGIKNEGDDNESVDSQESTISPTERAAKWIADRNRGVRPIIHLLENYYMMHEMSFSEARRFAMRVVLGHVSAMPSSTTTQPSTRASSRGGRAKPTSKRAQVVVRVVEKICLSLLTAIGAPFQREFSKAMPLRELAALEEESHRVEEAPTGQQLQIGADGRHYHVKAEPTNTLYSSEFINDLLGIDDDISDLKAGAFEYIRAMDIRDARKKGLNSSVDLLALLGGGDSSPKK